MLLTALKSQKRREDDDNAPLFHCSGVIFYLRLELIFFSGLRSTVVDGCGIHLCMQLE